ncbi:MAG TPA: prevent-host-death protein [Thermoanaerobaculia bacterium]|nr:prevent-host-death protein [Thermoanaerobaculia bacterium]
MKKIALAEVEDDLAKYLLLAEDEEVVIDHPGWKARRSPDQLQSEEDWPDWEVENDPRFPQRIEAAGRACGRMVEYGWRMSRNRIALVQA